MTGLGTEFWALRSDWSTAASTEPQALNTECNVQISVRDGGHTETWHTSMVLINNLPLPLHALLSDPQHRPLACFWNVTLASQHITDISLAEKIFLRQKNYFFFFFRKRIKFSQQHLTESEKKNHHRGEDLKHVWALVPNCTPEFWKGSGTHRDRCV